MKYRNFSPEDHSSKRKSKQTPRLDDNMQIFNYRSVSKSNDTVLHNLLPNKSQVKAKTVTRKKPGKNTKQKYFKVIQGRRYVLCRYASCEFKTDSASSMNRHLNDLPTHRVLYCKKKITEQTVKKQASDCDKRPTSDHSLNLTLNRKLNITSKDTLITAYEPNHHDKEMDLEEARVLSNSEFLKIIGKNVDE